MSTMPLRQQLRGLWEEQQTEQREAEEAARIQKQAENYRWFTHLLARVFDGHTNLTDANAIAYLQEHGIDVPGPDDYLAVTVDGVQFSLDHQPPRNPMLLVQWQGQDGKRHSLCDVSPGGLKSLAAIMAEKEGWTV